MQESKVLQNHARIVVIDDSEYSRRSIVQALEKAGYNVVGEAASAQEGTEVMGNQNANLLILDVVMPDISGIELTKYLKENFTKLAIIIISSLNQEHIILEAMTSGASDFLHKPFTIDELINSVAKVSEEIKEDHSF